MSPAAHRWIPHTALWALWGLLGCGSATIEVSVLPDFSVAAPFSLCINELMPRNQGSLLEGGRFPDWVELHNPTSQAIELDRYGLSDDVDDPFLHVLDGVLDARAYMLVFLDGETGPFGLSGEGEAVVLSHRDGRRSILRFGAAEPDVAWARMSDCCIEEECWEAVYFGTPGLSNIP